MHHTHQFSPASYDTGGDTEITLRNVIIMCLIHVIHPNRTYNEYTGTLYITMMTIL